MSELISNIDEAIENIEIFSNYNQNGSNEEKKFFKRIMMNNRKFVILEKENDYLFCPVRFVGYKNNSLCDYKERGGNLPDNKIQKILENFSEQLKSKSLEFKKIENIFFNYGIAPSNEVPRQYWLINNTNTLELYHTELNQKILDSQKLDSKSRKERLKKAHKKPEIMETTCKCYKRNPDVIAEVLERANGYCEKCKEKAPFISSSTGQPYLEVHHKIWLSKDGDDTVENSIALCPNCHRKEHFGKK